MAVDNTILVRRGSGTPDYTDFAQYELAYDYTNDKLYIRDGNAMVEVGGGGGSTGDIEGVTAGTGLSGGGTSGTVTLNLSNHSASLITSGTLNNARLNTDMQLSAAAPRYKLQETGVTNTPVWWMIADGGNYSIRLNNTGNYPMTIQTNGENNAVSSVNFAYNTNITNGGQLTLSGGTNAVINVNSTADSFIEKDSGTNLYLANNASNQDIYIRVNDGGSNVNAIHIDASESARVRIPNDGQRLSFGADQDMQLSHESNNNYIATYSGNLILEQNTNDKDIIFNCDNGSGGVTAYLTLDGSATSIKVAKNLELADNVRLRAGSSDDLQLYHDTSNSYITNDTGDLVIRNNANDKDILFQTDNNYGDTTNYLQLDGSELRATFNVNTRFNDSKQVQIGSSADFKITHDGSNTDLTNATGDLKFTLYQDDGDIRFFNDNGSGGTTEYFRMDGGAVAIDLFQDTRLKAGKKLYLDGGGNSYIQEESADNLIFRAAGGNYLRITGSNIVLNDPGASYDVRIEGDTDSNLFFADGSADKVGIGTSLPANKLEVEFANSALSDFGQGILIHTNPSNFTNGRGGGLEFRNADVQTAGVYGIRIGGWGSGLAFYTHSTSSGNTFGTTYLERMRIDSSGNLGIGTESPDTKLDITASGVNGVVINQDAANADISSRLFFKEQNSTIALYNTGDTFSFRTGATINSTSGTQRFYVNTSGANVVGDLAVSGNTVLQYGLVVNEGSHDADFRVESNGQANMLKVDAGSNYVGIAAGTPYERLYVQCEDATSPGIVSNPSQTNGAVAYAIGYGDANKDYLCTWGMEYSGGGNVIGYGVKPSTTTAGAFINSADNSNFTRGALLIDNELRFFNAGAVTGTIDTAITMTERFRVNTSGTGHFDGDVVAYSTTVSDKRLKENITTIDNALDKVMALRGVEYDWTATLRKGTHDIGLVAQEVEEVIPELVTEHELCTGEFSGEGNEKTFKTVNYDKMVGVLIEAIKEQQQQINELKEKLNG